VFSPWPPSKTIHAFQSQFLLTSCPSVQKPMWSGYGKKMFVSAYGSSCSLHQYPPQQPFLQLAIINHIISDGMSTITKSPLPHLSPHFTKMPPAPSQLFALTMPLAACQFLDLPPLFWSRLSLMTPHQLTLLPAFFGHTHSSSVVSLACLSVSSQPSIKLKIDQTIGAGLLESEFDWRSHIPTEDTSVIVSTDWLLKKYENQLSNWSVSTIFASAFFQRWTALNVR